MVQQLSVQRREFPFPTGFRDRTDALAKRLLGLLFPHFSKTLCIGDDLGMEIHEVKHEFESLLSELGQVVQLPNLDVPEALLAQLITIHQLVLADASLIFERDPAAESLDEVILAYPGLLAIAVYRIANRVHRLGVPILPRLFSEWAHHRTGIDIHPGASIGSPLFIDHGTGLVIGSTAVVGDGVQLYQGVTLGSLSVDKSHAGTKRHPTIESGVVIYAHATILGGSTVIGEGSIIGGNVWVTESVPSNSIVTRRSEIRVRSHTEPADVLDWSI